MAHNVDTHTGPSFSIRNRVARIAWGLVYTIFFRLSPIPFHSWRSLLLRLFGAKVGKGVHVYPRVHIWAPWNLQLEDECGIANGTRLYSQAKITIGKRTVISQGVHLCAGTHDYNHRGFPLIAIPINIGDQVWIAAEVFIHPGITIKDGCVVGARSVVNKDLPEWTVCGGHPCIPIKGRRFEKVEEYLNKNSTKFTLSL